MTAEEIVVDAGRVVVLHRLALAVEAVDAVTQERVAGRIRVARETVRSPAGDLRRGFDDHGGAVFVLRHRANTSATAVVRVTDPGRIFVARRLSVPLWPRNVVAQADAVPPAGPYIPARSRLLRPWLLPGAGHGAPRGTTGLRARIMVQGAPARWARVEVFTVAGRIGWGHGDDRGEVVVLATLRGAFPPVGTTGFAVAVRVHVPDPLAPPPDPDALLRDPLADLVVEQVPRSAAPPAPQDLDNDRLRGLAVPAGYVTAPDQVRNLTIGVITELGDIAITP